MSDFEYDCLQKKRLAGQAKYRKRGSKSKKCTLPSDRLTKKQWKERCGEIVSYNLSKPMKWADFKSLPVDVQAEYITTLQKRFGITAVDLAEMFGVAVLTVRKHTANKLDGVSFPKGKSMSASRRDEWKKFLVNEQESGEEVSGDIVSCEEQDNNNCPRNVVMSDTQDKDMASGETTDKMKMKNMSLHFCGTMNVDMIANSLRLILGENSNGDVWITCNLL